MRLKLEFNVDNAVYRDDTDAVLCGEVAATLRKAADIVEMHGTQNEPSLRNASWLIVDPNGNTVGRWTFVDDSDVKSLTGFPQHLLREDGPVDGPYPYHD